MRNLKTVLLLSLFIFWKLSTSQELTEGKLDNFDSELIDIQYDFIDNEYGSICMLDSIEKGVVIIRFNEIFNDSVEVYINHKLIKKSYVETITTISYSGLSIRYKNELYPVSPLLIIKLPNKKKYMQLSLDTRFKVVQIYRYENQEDEFDNFWRIIYRNFLTN